MSFNQPKNIVNVETNKQAIARALGIKASEVAYLKVGLNVSGYKVLYDRTTQTSWYLGITTGTILSWVITPNSINVNTSNGTFNLTIMDLVDWSELTGSDSANKIGYSDSTIGESLDSLVSAASVPNDLIIFPNYRSDEESDTRIMYSTDGILFNTVNDNPLSTKGMIDPLSMGPSGHLWRDGTLYLVVGWYSLDEWDCTVYKTTDGLNYERIRVSLGSQTAGSATRYAPGGTVPANYVWSPIFIEDGDDLYLGVSLPYTTNENDINGNALWGNFRNFLSKCTDFDSLTFDTPVLVEQTNNQHCQIDGMYHKVDNVWHMFSKNDYNKNVEQWASSNLIGPYTKVQDVILYANGQAEAPYLVEWTESLPKYRLYADSYVTGSYIYLESNDLSTWTAPQQIEADRANRHGSFSNTSFMDDKSKKLVASILSMKGSKSGKITTLTASNTAFHPRDGYVYAVTGTNAIELTIAEYSAKEFYLTVLSQSPLAKIQLNVNSYYGGVGAALPLILNGAEHGNKLIKVKQLGSTYVVDAVTSLDQSSIAFSSVSGFPTLSAFAPQVGALYTTDGSTTYVNNVVISGMASGYPDGAHFYVQVQAQVGSNGVVVFTDSATNMVTSALTLSPGTQQVYEVRKIAGSWRIMA